MSDPILVTGAAGFIGFHTASRLLAAGHRVVGLDNLSDYYDPAIKRDRLAKLHEMGAFNFKQMDLVQADEVNALFVRERFSHVVHLAAQAGVRYSLSNPQVYVESNLVGFANILEACRHNACQHLIYASSSSVYGANTKLPFSTSDTVDHPISLYAASKKANELMAHTYSHLFAIPTTGLRFFTVYGPWGRPDMAMWLFAKAIYAGEPIRLFNHGKMRRDFTYVDDVSEAIVRLIPKAPKGDPSWSGDIPNPATSFAPWRVFNIGNSSPVELMYLVECMEKAIGKTAVKEFLPMQPGDVPATYADVRDLNLEIGFQPRTTIEDGIGRFIAWFRDYHRM